MFVDSSVKAELLSWIPASSSSSADQMQVDQPAASKPAQPTTTATTTPPAPTAEPVPEAEVYLRLLIIHLLLTNPSNYQKAIQLSSQTAHKILQLSRRSMDPIAAKVWFALERSYELGGILPDARPLFLAAHKTAGLRHDDETLASLTNRLLRSYLESGLYSQAAILISKTTFPTSATNPQFCRYHYYLGRIQAVQLNYSASHANLQQAIRRAPPAKQAPGFWQAVHKLNVVVQLLMGDIPERSLFRDPVLEKSLFPYLEVVRSVRTGSLEHFQAVLAKHSSQFEGDRTYTLITRLRQNVIKTGIKKLSLSYSRISLRDICIKLSLDSEEDAEYIVGKAIRDGVIEGKTVIVHDKGWMECSGVKGGYGIEVAEVFQRRIGYCLELHNESVKVCIQPFFYFLSGIDLWLL
jgi:26S proteasome regulatory subunit N3